MRLTHFIILFAFLNISVGVVGALLGRPFNFGESLWAWVVMLQGAHLLHVLESPPQNYVPPQSDGDRLLDFLESHEYSTYFNSAIESGMWGVVDQNLRTIAVGHTVRQATRRAQDVANNRTVTHG